MYPRAFHYHRAGSLKEAAAMLSQLGDDAKLLAGGQSLIPLMKLRFANPAHLVDLNFYRGNVATSRRTTAPCVLGRSPVTRKSRIPAVVAKIPILHDCAAGIADVQVRNRGTIGGSLAEADPSGDWAVVLSTLIHRKFVVWGKTANARSIFKDFIKDAYTTALAHDELVSEVSVKIPAKGSGGAYLAFKRAAPVYPTASAAVQLTLDGNVCKEVAIALGCVGLTADQGQRSRSRPAWPAIIREDDCCGGGRRPRRR